MRQTEVKIGAIYWALVGSEPRQVLIDAVSPFGGWTATSLQTKRRVRIRTSQRLHLTREALNARRYPEAV